MKNLIIILALIATGCVGPKFRAPVVEVPVAYLNSDNSSTASRLSEWWRNFNDPVLDSLETTAIANNLNFAVAIRNIDIARMGIASARSAALPSISLSGTAGAKYTYDTKTDRSYSAMPVISWDIDLWGKIRRQTEAAGASYHATEFETAAVLQALTAEVATTYFAALSYKMALDVSRATFDSRLQSNTLMDSMFRYGYISEVDLSQSRASLALAAASVEQYRRAYNQASLSLNLLLGENPKPLTLGSMRQTNMDIPAGLPSSLLERRPDVMQSYFGVQQANAMIGVAVANRLPSLSLTGQGGYAETIVKDISTGKPLGWSAAASLIAPILNWGTLRRNEKAARIQTEQAVLGYEQSVLTAINEVEQALVAVRTYNSETVASYQTVVSSQKAAMLTNALYKAGSSSYLDVLDADRTLLSAQLQYAQTLSNQYASYITLYKALGGGW